MTEVLDSILARYGRDIEITRDGDILPAKAFLQPVTQREKALPYEATSLGSVDDRLWRCLTRTALAEGDVISCGGEAYRVQNCAAVYAGRELSHWWGALTPEREAAE